MSNELATQENAITYAPEMPSTPAMDFANINQGTVAIEASRAICFQS